MKKAILVFLCLTMLVSMISCDINLGNKKVDTQTSDTQTTDSDTAAPCAHTLGEWSVSKEATERENGEEKRTCSFCEYFETKPIHAKGTEGLSFTLSED